MSVEKLKIKSFASYLEENFRENKLDYLTVVYASKTKQYSYQDFVRIAVALAKTKLGMVSKLERVAIFVDHGILLYASFLSCLLKGAIPSIFSPPSPKMSESDYGNMTRSILDNASFASVIITQSTLDKISTMIPDSIQVTIVNEQLSESDANESNDDILNFIRQNKRSSSEPLFIQYSSGTTGVKKGVAITEEMLVNQLESYMPTIQLNPKENCIVSWLPLYHDMGLITCFFMPLLSGVKLVAQSPYDWVKNPKSFLELIDLYNATHCWLPNFSYNFMAQRINLSEIQNIDLSSLKSIVNCSEPVLSKSHSEFYEKFKYLGLRLEALKTCYAMAENTFAVAQSNSIQTKLDKEKKGIISSGKILPGVLVKCIGEDGQETGEGKIGEILIKSPSLFDGYVKKDSTFKDISSFVEGWYATGDIGIVENDEIYVLGRKMDRVIIAGQNVFTQDLEDLINRVDGVLPGRVCVFGQPNISTGTEELHAIVECEEDYLVNHVDLELHIREKIASCTEFTLTQVHFRPSKWLMKSSSGKISRKKNRDKLFLEMNEKIEKIRDNGEVIANANECDLDSKVEEVIRNIVGESNCLNIDKSTPLLTSGYIDSLSWQSMISKLESTFSIKISAEQFSNVKNWDTMSAIAKSILTCKEKSGKVDTEYIYSKGNISMYSSPKIINTTNSFNFWSLYYKLYFRLVGIKYGKNLTVLGPLLLRTQQGRASNIEIGDHVTLFPGVDLKVRENGHVKINNGAYIDMNVRIVAANHAQIDIGENVSVGRDTTINAGTDIKIGADCAIGGHCHIVSSEHKYTRGKKISEQGYTYAPINIYPQVWVGTNVYIRAGSTLSKDCIVGINSVVVGSIPENAIVMGNPAQIVKFRE